MSLRCLIVDDEPNAVSLLEMLIGQTTSWQVAGKCYNGLEAITYLKRDKVDLLFIDINMPQLNGMDLAALLPPDIKIVFTTAYAEHAVDSYAYHTIDYLLKPITLKRFLAATKKIEAAFTAPVATTTAPIAAATDIGATPPDNDHFFIKTGKTLRRISLSDILCFEGEKEYVRLVTLTEELLIYRRLKDIESQLAAPFIRVHNSYIINTRLLTKVQDNHVFIGSKQIPVSDKFREGFMELISKRLF